MHGCFPPTFTPVCFASTRRHDFMSQIRTQLTDCQFVKTHRWPANGAWNGATTPIGSETWGLCIGNGRLILHSTVSLPDGPAWHATAAGVTPCKAQTQSDPSSPLCIQKSGGLPWTGDRRVHQATSLRVRSGRFYLTELKWWFCRQKNDFISM